MLNDLFDAQPARRMVAPASPEPAARLIESCGAFGWLANERDRAVMIEFRHENGDSTALAYPLLESVKFNPSSGITLSFSGTTVKISGTNLNAEVRPGLRLFECITRHRVAWVQEMDDAKNAESSATQPTIDEISITT
ncbi:MAG TPA: hypothetical protein PK867_14285 [Pirellulales bacterium]|nr:hypothetical protein [Pirellulales bacterium]